MYNEYELPAMGQRQKSFYGKARVQETPHGKRRLMSYGTLVASYDNGTFKRHWPGYSATTVRHVDAFRSFCGLPGRMGKAEWEALPVED